MDQIVTPLAKHTIDAASVATVFATFLGWLPPIAALLLTFLGIGWYGVLFYDRFIGRGRKTGDE